MTYRLYNRDGSGGFAAEAALTLADASFELIKLKSLPGTALPSSFREINPWGQVPVLITADGTLLTETGAILAHIAACYPGPNIGPKPGTSAFGELLRWSVFMSVNVYENIHRTGYPERFTTDPNGIQGVVEASSQRLGDALQLIEQALERREFLLGEGMSVVDIYLAMLNAWHGERRGYPRCDAVTHKIARYQTIAPIWQRNFDHRLPTKWGRL